MRIPFREPAIRVDLEAPPTSRTPSQGVTGDTVFQLDGIEVEARARIRRDPRQVGVSDDYIDPERMDVVRDHTRDFQDLLIRELGPGVRITPTTQGGSGQGFCVQSTRRRPTLYGEAVTGCRPALLIINGMPYGSIPTQPSTEGLRWMDLEEVESVRWIPPLDARLLYGQDRGKNGVLEIETRKGGSGR